MNEASMLNNALQGLFTAGPVATILGVFCYFLWRQNAALLADLRADKIKMVKIAMRVTKAVEALAGIEASDDTDLDGDED